MKKKQEHKPAEEQQASGRERGRPVLFPMPERIDAPPEEIAEVVLGAKPKATWRYEEETGRQRTQEVKA